MTTATRDTTPKISISTLVFSAAICVFPAIFFANFGHWSSFPFWKLFVFYSLSLSLALLYQRFGLRVSEEFESNYSKYGTLILSLFAFFLSAVFFLLFDSNSFVHPGITSKDGIYYAHETFNMAKFFSPENTIYALPHHDKISNSYGGKDPLWSVITGYVSSFIPFVSGYFLPKLVYPIFYKFHPQAHFVSFLSFFFAFLVGGTGLYKNLRHLNYKTLTAQIYSILFLLTPIVLTTVLMKNRYEGGLGIAILPWLFYGILSEKKWIYLVSMISFTLTSYGHIYYAIGVSFFALIAKRDKFYILPILIGLIIYLFIKQLHIFFLQELGQEQVYSTIKSYILTKDFRFVFKAIGSLIELILFPFTALIALLLSKSKLQDFKDKNLFILGSSALLGLAMLIWRSPGFGHHRNSLLLIPSFLLITLFIKKMEPTFKGRLLNPKTLFPAICLTFAVLLPFPKDTAALDFVSLSKGHYKYHSTIGRQISDILATHTPHNSSLAHYTQQTGYAWMYEGLLSNRRYSWRLGREPKTVDYFLTYGEAADTARLYQENLSTKNLKQTFNQKVGLYQLTIYKNPSAGKIPRNEKLLGFKPVWTMIKNIFN